MATENLHIPQKFTALGARPFVRKIVNKFTGRDEPVTGDDLEEILTEYLRSYGDGERQNWLEVERWAQRFRPASGVSPFDAVIDSTLSSPDVANHRYPNLTTLNANESWASDHTFVIGVVTNSDTPIVEAGSAINPDGPFAMIAFPPTVDFPFAESLDLRQVWETNGSTIVGNNSTEVFRFEGLHIQNEDGSAVTRFVVDAGAHLKNCVVVSVLEGTPDTFKLTFFCEFQLRAEDCGFASTCFDNNTLLVDCHYFVSRSTAYTMISDASLIWLGGTWGGTGSATVTIDESDLIVYLNVNDDTHIFGSAGGSNQTIALTQCNGYIDFGGGVSEGLQDVTVSANCGDLVVKGQVGDITITTNTNNALRHIDVVASGVADIGGPCLANIKLDNTDSRAIFRGSGVRANVAGRGNQVPTLDFIDCDDSLVVASLISSSAIAGKPYAIDANSNRTILIVSGANNGWPTAGTNASSTSIVIDETGLSGGGGATSRFLVGPWFQDDVAAGQSAVDLNLYGDTTRTTRVMTRGGSVTGVVVRSNEARTADTLTVDVEINGTATGLQAILNGTDTTVKATTQATGLDTFVAGGEIGVRLTTGAGWTPTTADITVEVEVTQ